ncbi:carbon-nitrogen hydrolase family protein [Rhizobium sp. CG4]|uniref:hypothetical protein n=1 Tax=Rhizobium sp. CG4 TaxID=2726075 RepID=UPI0020337071|nr:hypothetical protein [Rhizobium sp. CG4]MCM2454846.1 carbon-nitrogen hydrolase family protein [Rhizobium sp. CG4]
MLNDNLIVGVIQTSLDADVAWDKNESWKNAVKISKNEEARAKKEIRHYFSALRGLDKKPDVVLLPELAVPAGYESKLEKIAEDLQCIVIAGLDYNITTTTPPTVSNEAIVIVPRILRGTKIAAQTAKRRVGKTYAAPGERSKLNKIAQPVEFQPLPTVWLFESATLGNFGVAVCYDFLDLDRTVLYRKKIQTLFILAYNQDINTFDHVAESIARTVFCNVVVCNCGHFGGSMAVAPFREPFRRTVYRHSGNKLANVQVVELPLKDLADHHNNQGPDGLFKSLPPGFDALEHLNERTQAI